jgi:hypothetical protein
MIPEAQSAFSSLGSFPVVCAGPAFSQLFYEADMSTRRSLLNFGSSNMESHLEFLAKVDDRLVLRRAGEGRAVTAKHLISIFQGDSDPEESREFVSNVLDATAHDDAARCAEYHSRKGFLPSRDMIAIAALVLAHSEDRDAVRSEIVKGVERYGGTAYFALATMWYTSERPFSKEIVRLHCDAVGNFIELAGAIPDCINAHFFPDQEVYKILSERLSGKRREACEKILNGISKFTSLDEAEAVFEELSHVRGQGQRWMSLSDE